MMRLLTRCTAMMAALLAAAPQLLAQGCAMCYATAQSQDPRAARQLDLAILTLLVPSVLLFAGVLLSAFRRRDRDLDSSKVGQAFLPVSSADKYPRTNGTEISHGAPIPCK